MRVALLTAILCLASGCVVSSEPLTYVDLIRRLTDLEALAVLPAQGEMCSQWSSYDRASRYDAASGKYVGWDANGDGGGVIREEGNQVVMAEMDGPGCIWRIWSAAPKDGHVRIYLDGAAEPVVDLPFRGYFDRQNPPFVYPSLVYDSASGKNCYVPIPYRKSCKITADRNWGSYYHFNYTTFAQGTVVPTFKRDLSREEQAALQTADRFLTGGLGTDPAGRRPGEVTQAAKTTIPAGGRSVTVRLQGPRAITGIRARLDPDFIADYPNALREAVIRIRWDGEKDPSVAVPLIDFFGTAPNTNHYKSLPTGVTDEGLYAYWYMPFAKEAIVEFANDGSREFPLDVSITHAPLTRSAKRLGRFHAKWHRDAFLPTEPERWLDWTMLKTQGRGRFCGVSMHLWVPTGGWWGEGDEKFFVDGEKSPSTIGTGSEDYFGYAWGNPSLFAKAYHNQTRSDGNAGHVALNRWHITDNIPFQRSFEGFIEKYRSNARPALYACTAFWYLAPGGVDPYAPAPVNERVGYWVMPPTLTLEGEKLQVIRVTGGKTVQANTSGLWSEGSNFEWQGARPGDEMVCALPARSRPYRLVLRLTKSPDYGSVELMLDGKRIGEPADLHGERLAPADEMEVAVLGAGVGHELTIRIADTDDKGHGFGIDYLKLVPMQRERR